MMKPVITCLLIAFSIQSAASQRAEQLCYAASQGDLVGVRELVEKENVSVDVKNHEGLTPLIKALEGYENSMHLEHFPTIEYLLAKGASTAPCRTLDGTIEEPIAYAFGWVWSLPAVELLVQHKANPHAASRKKKKATVIEDVCFWENQCKDSISDEPRLEPHYQKLKKIRACLEKACLQQARSIQSHISSAIGNN